MFDKLNILAMARQRMEWVARRQEVLSENVANANTPGYRPKDLKPLDFKQMLNAPATVAASVTHPRHVAVPPMLPAGYEVETTRKPYETAPDGNAVVLEEQMQKIGEAKGAYDLAANLFQKHVRMIRTALGRGGGQ